MALSKHLKAFMKTRALKNPPAHGVFKDSADFFAYLGKKNVKYTQEELEDVADEMELSDDAREAFLVEAADWFGQKG